MPDEKPAASSSEAEAEASQDESLEQSEDGTETPEGDKSKHVPYDRFKQVNDEKKQAQSIVDWYRNNIGDPNDVVAFREWKASQVKKAKEAEDEGEITPKKLAEIKKLMRKADPEYAEFIESRKQETKDRIEAQFDTAEDEIRDLCEKGGFKKDNKIVARVARNVMMEIQEDPKLLRMWNSGNLSCIKKAFEKLDGEFLAPLRKTTGASAASIADKRRVSRLSTLPIGGSSSLSGTGNKGAKDEPKGITKKTHEDAWELVQQHLRE